ncbi:HVA22-like protein k [Rutidosis leptorrhynchoides]|uniref:HVA22-like protein k n=1 Tax=Rutidosis leptorrhynchoides TaxID=125765 RepID=UPI003A98FFDE
MSILGSNLPSELGLKLLLSPLGSNIVLKTACCSVGVVLPVYSTYKAIESKNRIDQQKWLVYWAAYGTFSVAEMFTDKLISWVPLYYHVKFAFLVWLQLPTTNGAKLIYMSHLRPFLLKHQANLDMIVSLLYSETGKFISAHEGEIRFVKAVGRKILMSAKQFVNDSSQTVPPVPPPEGRTIIVQTEQVENSESNDNNAADGDEDGYVTVPAT